MPKIIILCGIPGSGKSTWADWHSKHNWNVAVVSRDDIRETKFPQPFVYTKDNEEKVTEFFNGEVAKAIEVRYDIILDNTHASDYWLNKAITEYRAKGFAAGYKVYVKFFDIPLWKANWRVRRRFKKTGKNVPEKVVKDMHRNYKKIDKFKYVDYVL